MHRLLYIHSEDGLEGKKPAALTDSRQGAQTPTDFGQMHMRYCFIVQVPFSQIFSRLHMHQMPPTDRSGQLGLARGLIGTMLTILLMQGKPEHQAGFHSCSARLETWHQSVKIKSASK